MKSYRIQAPGNPAATAILAAVLCTTGCFSTARRLERHLAANPDRPDAIVQALREGDRALPGMTPTEVRLILGPPARTETGNAPITAIWHYDQPKRRGDSTLGSTMWSLPIPLQTVVFGADGSVTEIIDYDDQNTPQPDTQPQGAQHQDLPPPPAKPAGIAVPGRAYAVRPSTHAAALPAYRPNPEEANVHGWPAINLQGLTGGVSSRSAVINGNVYEPGDTISGARLDAVYANGVVLEYRSQRAFLRPGESTGNRVDSK